MCGLFNRFYPYRNDVEGGGGHRHKKELFLNEGSKGLNLSKEIKEKRDNKEVARVLQKVKGAAQKEEVNLIPYFLDAVKAYATVQEICDVLREVFGEHRPTTI